jgi:hypothetical protein
MPIAKTHFRCLLISPGDVQAERDALSEVVVLWNAHEGRCLGVSVELNRWETHTTPALGDRPQEIINKQIVDESDLGIAVFWSRLGTPTGQFPSGSAEEITRLAISKKRVMVYFKTASIPQHAAKEFQRLEAFKKELLSTGLCEDFNDVQSLREKVSHHITSAVAALLLAEESPQYPNSAAVLERMERLMPSLLAEMRQDLTDHPLRREVVVLKRCWVYPGKGNELIYFYDDHADLDDKLRILANVGLIQDITYNNIKRYVLSEQFAKYLGAP